MQTDIQIEQQQRKILLENVQTTHCITGIFPNSNNSKMQCWANSVDWIFYYYDLVKNKVEKCSVEKNNNTNNQWSQYCCIVTMIEPYFFELSTLLWSCER